LPCGAGRAAGWARAQNAPDARLPTFAELEAKGARIGEIRIHADNIFDLNDPRENNFRFPPRQQDPHQDAPEVVRQALLFESGQPVSLQKIEETERLLRGYDFLYDVVIRPVACTTGWSTSRS
jgi:hypothetical protein